MSHGCFKSLGTSSVALGFAAGKSGEMLDKLQSLGIETDVCLG
jgi:fructose-1-phosphate kinase PfkB-like protein